MQAYTQRKIFVLREHLTVLERSHLVALSKFSRSDAVSSDLKLKNAC